MRERLPSVEFSAVGALNSDHLTRMLASKIRTLPPAYVAELEDFIDFLVLRAQSKAGDREMTRWSSAASEPAFAAVWSNPEDDVYDAL
jgi:hypothetical protein